jgi:Pectate lyase superfamily protein/Concanavalin A-like lectin/glucanases superfamily
MTEVCCSSPLKREFTSPLIFLAVVSCLALVATAPAFAAARRARPDGVFNVREPPFNAKGNGRSDDYGAIQSAINAACANHTSDWNGGAEVYLPPGTYLISQPLLLNCVGLTFAGAGQGSTWITNNNAAGSPLLLQVYPNYPPPNLTTALLSGSGQAWSFPTHANNYYGFSDFSLRGIKDMDLNGLSALTAEFSVRLSTIGPDAFLASSDVWGKHHAFEIYYNGSSTLTGTMTVGGTFHTLTGTWSPSTGTVYHIALDYDGSTIRLFVNGSQVASQSASGTINQNPIEDVTLGAEVAGLNGYGPFWRTSTGGFVIDSVRISKVARYTSNFSRPTAKFSNDSNTLALLNFDNNPTIFTVAQSQGGSTFLPVINQQYPPVPVYYSVVKNLTVNNGGVWEIGCQYCSIDNTSIWWARVGMAFLQNSYRSETSNSFIYGGSGGGNSWIDFATDGMGHPDNITNLQVSGRTLVGVYSVGGGNWNGVYESVSCGQVYPFWLGYKDSEADFTIESAFVDYEPGGCAGNIDKAMVTSVYIEGSPHVVFIGGTLEEYNSQPVITVDASVNALSTVTFVGTEFNTDGGNTGAPNTGPPSKLIDIVNTPAFPVLLINPNLRVQPGVPLTNRSSAVSLVGGAGGHASIFGAGVRARPLKAPDAPFVRTSGSNKLSAGNTAVDPAGFVMTLCTGRTRLSEGTAAVADSCIRASRPTGCTDNSSKRPSACSAIPSTGRIVLHGNGSDEVSWFQM